MTVETRRDARTARAERTHKVLRTQRKYVTVDVRGLEHWPRGFPALSGEPGRRTRGPRAAPGSTPAPSIRRGSALSQGHRRSRRRFGAPLSQICSSCRTRTRHRARSPCWRRRSTPVTADIHLLEDAFERASASRLLLQQIVTRPAPTAAEVGAAPAGGELPPRPARSARTAPREKHPRLRRREPREAALEL